MFFFLTERLLRSIRLQAQARHVVDLSSEIFTIFFWKVPDIVCIRNLGTFEYALFDSFFWPFMANLMPSESASHLFL